MAKRRTLAVAIAIAVAILTAGLVWAQQAKAGALATQDYVDIAQLYARYNTAIDTGDADGWAATFTPDGVFNGTTRGHEALVQFVHDWRDKRNGANRRHWNSNLVVTRTPEGANGSVYLQLLDVGVRPAAATLTAMYEDRLVKTADGWRFKSRLLHNDPVAAR